MFLSARSRVHRRRQATVKSNNVRLSNPHLAADLTPLAPSPCLAKRQPELPPLTVGRVAPLPCRGPHSCARTPKPRHAASFAVPLPRSCRGLACARAPVSPEVEPCPRRRAVPTLFPLALSPCLPCQTFHLTAAAPCRSAEPCLVGTSRPRCRCALPCPWPPPSRQTAHRPC